jgi:hypothetical protein
MPGDCFAGPLDTCPSHATHRRPMKYYPASAHCPAMLMAEIVMLPMTWRAFVNVLNNALDMASAGPRYPDSCR